jgi:hypothetical protein
MDQDFFTEHGIIPQKLNPDDPYYSIGFSQVEQKWYGWTENMCRGFGVGDRTEKGYSGYVATTPEEMIDDYANFFLDISQECADKYRAQCSILPDRSGILICADPILLPTAGNSQQLLAVLDGILDENLDLPVVAMPSSGCYVRLCGIGDRPAKSLEEAYQLACSFAQDAY